MVGDFLFSQLKYFGQGKTNIELILIALVSSYGTKTQKSIEELIDETGIKKSFLEQSILSLVDSRLIRHTEDGYEIAHDFLSNKILNELASEEQKEIKRFKDLLSSKTQAFVATQSQLTLLEHVNIYKFRDKIHITKDELVFLGGAYDNGTGPLFYWLDKYRDQLSEPLICNRAFYNSSSEMFNVNNWAEESLLEEYEDSEPQPLKLLKDIDIRKFSRSSKTEYRYELVKIAERFSNEFKRSEVIAMLEEKPLYKKLFATYLLGFIGKKVDILAAKKVFKDDIIDEKVMAGITFAMTSIYSRYGDKSKMEQLFLSKPRSVSIYAIESLQALNSSGISINFLIENIVSSERFQFSGIREITLRLISDISERKDLTILKALLKNTNSYSPDLDPIIQSIGEYGSASSLPFLVDYFRNVEHFSGTPRLDLATGIGLMADESSRKFVMELIMTPDFWVSSKLTRQLNIDGIDYNVNYNCKNYEIEYFLRWVAAVAFTRFATTEKDLDIAIHMLNHNYWTVRNSAVHVIKNIGGKEEIPILIERIISDHTSYKENEEMVEALVSIDEKLYRTEHTEKLVRVEDFPF